MMKSILVFLTLANLCIANADPSPYRYYVQADGSEVQLKTEGSELYTWKSTTDGYFACYHRESKQYQYCQCSEASGLTPNGVPVRPSNSEFVNYGTQQAGASTSKDRPCLNTYIRMLAEKYHNQ
ncbi:MAG: hypothetical protein CL675_06215 [Bdellovibrionaceae bacterium]|nr:hypothetical protein [Pseudobdellovibrionaceae bacterium]